MDRSEISIDSGRHSADSRLGEVRVSMLPQSPESAKHIPDARLVRRIGRERDGAPTRGHNSEKRRTVVPRRPAPRQNRNSLVTSFILIPNPGDLPARGSPPCRD